MRRTHSIDLSPDQAPKPSYIKQVITRQAGFIRRLSYPHWYFLAFAGDRPAIDDGAQGRCRIRLMPSSILQNEKCWPSIVPRRCRHLTTCIISVCAMTDPRCSRPFCFEQKIVSDRQFPLEIQYNDAIFQPKQKGMGTRRAIFSIKKRRLRATTISFKK